MILNCNDLLSVCFPALRELPDTRIARQKLCTLYYTSLKMYLQGLSKRTKAAEHIRRFEIAIA